jgi:hypothetical protein
MDSLPLGQRKSIAEIESQLARLGTREGTWGFLTAKSHLLPVVLADKVEHMR